MRPPVRALLQQPVRSWWKQERREHPRSQVRKPLLLALLLLTAVLAWYLGRDLLVFAALVAVVLLVRAKVMLERRRQNLRELQLEQKSSRRLRQTSHNLDAVLQQLGMPPDSFKRSEINFKVNQLASRMEWLLESARSLALLDSLTQLPNRRHFIEQVQIESARSKRSRKRFAVLFIDVDKFKAINDTYGHATGDRALVAVSQRLKDTIRAGDFLSRLGGDEFAVLMDLSAIKNN